MAGAELVIHFLVPGAALGVHCAEILHRVGALESVLAGFLLSEALGRLRNEMAHPMQLLLLGLLLWPSACRISRTRRLCCHLRMTLLHRAPGHPALPLLLRRIGVASSLM